MAAKTAKTRIPSLRLHKPSGRAVVRLNGRDHYVGAYGSDESRAAYETLIAQWLAGGRRPIDESETARAEFTISMLIARWWRSIKGEYHPRTEAVIGAAMRRLRDHCGAAPARSFGPLGLQAVRDAMIAEGLSRRYINNQIAWMQRLFRWGVSQELLDPMVAQALGSVDGLRQGRTAAVERPPVRPVPDADVDATVAKLAPVVADMVRVQRLTGMRPGELCAMTWGQIDREGEIWRYRPERHKSAWRGSTRDIPIGPRAQAVLMRYLTRPADAPIFSPRQSEAQRKAGLRDARTAHRSTNRARDAARRRNPKRRISDAYTPDVYARAIKRAAKRAGVDAWAPNRLRHTKASEVRREFGFEAAGATLGHSQMSATNVYAERNQTLAVDVARQTG